MTILNRRHFIYSLLCTIQILFNLKVKLTSEQTMKAHKGSRYIYSSALSLISALDGGGVQRHTPNFPLIPKHAAPIKSTHTHPVVRTVVTQSLVRSSNPLGLWSPPPPLCAGVKLPTDRRQVRGGKDEWSCTSVPVYLHDVTGRCVAAHVIIFEPFLRRNTVHVYCSVGSVGLQAIAELCLVGTC